MIKFKIILNKKATLDQKKKKVTLDHQTRLKHEIHFLSRYYKILMMMLQK